MYGTTKATAHVYSAALEAAAQRAREACPAGTAGRADVDDRCAVHHSPLRSHAALYFAKISSIRLKRLLDRRFRL